MDIEKFYEKILISIALILCAGIICFNFFFVPMSSPATIIYIDNNDSENSKSLESININLASSQELTNNLPGIGKVVADRIIEYRNSNNNFKNIEEIKNVKGVGEKNFEKIKDLICI